MKEGAAAHRKSGFGQIIGEFYSIVIYSIGPVLYTIGQSATFCNTDSSGFLDKDLK